MISSFTCTSKHTIWSTSVLILLSWSNKSSSSYILHIKNLRQLKRILDKLFILWMLQRIFHTSTGPLQLLVCTSWLSAKLKGNDGHDFLNASLKLLQFFGIRIRRWRFLKTIHNIPNIHGCQQHFDFEPLNVEISFIGLVSDSSSLVLKWYHATVRSTLKILKQYTFSS
jgi:hypothetical protein